MIMLLEFRHSGGSFVQKENATTLCLYYMNNFEVHYNSLSDYSIMKAKNISRVL